MQRDIEGEPPRGQAPTQLLRDHDYTDFIGPHDGPGLPANLKATGFASLLNSWFIKPYSSKVLQEIEVIAPGPTSATCVDLREKTRGSPPSGCQCP